MFSNIFQQFYNTADSLIIGRFLGGNAFASTGISVIFAQSYGVGDKEAFRRKLFLAFTTGLLLSVFFGVTATLSLNTLLSLIQTPDILMDYCRIYMTIILIGLPATFLYNFFAAILRSVGNTKAALCFLLISVTANLIFDYLLIAMVKTEISGAAYATVISQLLSALCCLIYLKKKYGEYICTKKNIGFELPLFLQILQFGLVSALHQSSLYIGKILVQGAVNTLGTEGIESGVLSIGAAGPYHFHYYVFFLHSLPVRFSGKRRRFRHIIRNLVPQNYFCVLCTVFYRKRVCRIFPWNRKDDDSLHLYHLPSYASGNSDLASDFPVRAVGGCHRHRRRLDISSCLPADHVSQG